MKDFHKQLINNLNARGWAAYKAPNLTITSLDELEKMVSEGSEKERLADNIPYQILPLIEDDTNYEKIRKVMLNCVITNRYPFFIDFLLDDIDENNIGKLKTEGVYLIDSVLFNSILNIFELIPDYILMNQLGIYTENKGNIILTIYEIDKLLKQLTKCVR